MIVRPRPNAFRLFFYFQMTILRKIIIPVLAIFLFSCGVMFYEHLHPAVFRNFSATPFALFGIGISIFIAFRNNSAYDRWYEARKNWGLLLIETRSFARTAVTLLDEATARLLIYRTIAYTYALNASLRRQELPQDIAPYLSAEELELARTQPNVPNVLLQSLSLDIANLLKRGELSDILYKTLDEHLNSFAMIQGACERILTTPTPFTYTLLLHRATIVLCLLLPFGLASSLGYVTPLICGLVAYSFLGIDALCDELEQPFASNPNSLPLNAISRTIEIDLVRAIDNETELVYHLPKEFILD